MLLLVMYPADIILLVFLDLLAFESAILSIKLDLSLDFEELEGIFTWSEFALLRGF
mgnify:FL=1